MDMKVMTSHNSPKATRGVVEKLIHLSVGHLERQIINYSIMWNYWHIDILSIDQDNDTVSGINPSECHAVHKGRDIPMFDYWLDLLH